MNLSSFSHKASKGKILSVLLLAGLVEVTGLTDAELKAEIPVERFLARLQEERLHGLASEYLDYLRQRNLLPEQVKEDYSLTKLEVMQNEIPNIASLQKRDARIAELQAGYKSFLNEQKDHPRRGEARVKLADLYIQEGQSSIDRVSKTGEDAEKQALLAKARVAFQEAEKLFDEGVKELAPELNKVIGAKIDASDVKAIERRDFMKAEYRKSQIMIGMARKLVAETYPAESKEQADWLGKAETQFAEVSSKASRTTEAGPYMLSVLYRGQVQAALKKSAEATDSLLRVADQNEGGVFRVMRVQATASLVRLLASKTEAKYDAAIERGESLLKEQQQNEKDSPDWQELQLAILEAKQALLDSLKGDSKNESKSRALTKELRTELQKLSRLQTPVGDKARELLTAFGVDVEVPEDTKLPRVRNFAEAFKEANERLDRSQQDKLTLQIIETQLKSNPQNKDQLQAQLDRLNAGMSNLRSQAIQLYQRSLQLYKVGQDERLDLSAARFRLAFLLYTEGRYNESAVVGDLTARTNRGTTEGLSAAQIAIASYQQLITSAPSADAKPLQALEQFASYVLDVWPNEEASEAAAAALLKSALEDKRYEDAVKVLAFIKSESKKAEIQRDLGFVFYNQFVIAEDALRKSGNTSGNEDVTKLRNQAEDLLKQGLAVLKPDSLNERAIEAGYALAEIQLRQQQVSVALETLNRPEVGPIPVIDAGTLELKPKVRMDVLRSALQASVGMAISGGQALDAAKVESLVGQMQKVAGESPENKVLLTNALIVLANELKSQLADKKSIDEKQKLGSSLKVLLGQLIDVSQDASMLEWSAGTLAELGGSTAELPGLKSLSDELKAGSEKGFVKLAELVRKDPSVLQGSRKPEEVQQFLAKAYTANGRFAEADQIYQSILTTNNMMLLAQIDAALNYQLWSQDKDAEKLKFAISGNIPDPKKAGKNLIWGWGQISILLSKNMAKQEALKPFFFDSRYQLAYCRAKLAALEADSTKQSKLHEQALADIRTTYINFPALGDSEPMKKKFDDLARSLQAALKQEAAGLAAFDKK